MVTISTIEARKILGNKAGRYTDFQLETIINSFVTIADLAIDESIKKRTLDKTVNPIGVTERRNYGQNL